MHERHIINGNYGNHTIALIQWAYERALNNVTIVSIDTGWQAKKWQARVIQGEAFAKRCGFATERLLGKPSFQTLMHDRKEFPSTKFQWCAGFLKGLPLLDWLDTQDCGCEAVILLGKRRLDSRANANLPEFISESEHYGDRKIWYPLYDCEHDNFFSLINRAGFAILEHRSLECDPCIHSNAADLVRLHQEDVQKTRQLEQELGKTLFEYPLEEMVRTAKKSAATYLKQQSEMFDMGCGSPFACGE